VSRWPFVPVAFDACAPDLAPVGHGGGRPDLSLRVELDNATGRGFERMLYACNGPRNTSSLAYVDDRRQEIGQYVHIRLRKSFG